MLAVCVAAALVGSGGYVAKVSGQAPAPAVDSYQSTVLPILAKNCFSCHSDQLHTSNLSLEAFHDSTEALQRRDVWVKVLDKLKAGTMPPRSMAPVAPADHEAVVGWIEKSLGAASTGAISDANADPGRVSARRLNRTEYNNTIRDLLGVTLRPADEFPVDDSGYGFDNIGDVLSMSPMLMEKYMNAARVVSQAAVFGEPYQAKPGLMVKLEGKKIQDDMQATGNITPFSARGSVYTTYHFPVDAEYEFHIRYQNFRGGEQVIQADANAPARGRGPGPQGAPAGAQGAPAAGGTQGATAGAQGAPDPQGVAAAGRGGRGRGGPLFVRRPLSDGERKARLEAARTAAPAEPLVFTIDGNQVYQYVVQGTTDYEYARGENVVRVKLSAGDHALRASFPNYANMDDPRKNINPADGRRRLYVDYMDVLGPYAPGAEPPASHKKIFICTPEAKGPSAQQCARQIIEHLLMRAYRRPVTADETQKLLALAAQVQKKDSFDESIRVVIQAVLVSPEFLYRIERDQAPAMASTTPQAARAVAYRVNDFELASRLSYFLWSSMPDDELFDAASRGMLHEPSALRAQVERMVRDPKSASLADNFAAQWLNLRLMDRKKPDAAKFPLVDDELLDAMRRETLLFVDAIIREDRSVLDFIDGKFTYVNGPLARYYGIRGVDGEPMQRVQLDGEQRSGILTQASILSISSYATRTSPVLRGKWVLDNLLGAAPPPPPDGVPPLVEAGLGTATSMRARLEQHRASPSCSVCHNQMDPIGFGLENYDASGSFRTRDGNFEIDSSGTLPDGRSFAGVKGLKEMLRGQADAFAMNFTEKLMTYALGRGLERADRRVVGEITSAAAADGYRFSSFVHGIISSRPFQMRALPEGAN
jgi:PAS domain-containing protein